MEPLAKDMRLFIRKPKVILYSSEHSLHDELHGVNKGCAAGSSTISKTVADGSVIPIAAFFAGSAAYSG